MCSPKVTQSLLLVLPSFLEFLLLVAPRIHLLLFFVGHGFVLFILFLPPVFSFLLFLLILDGWFLPSPRQDLLNLSLQLGELRGEKTMVDKLSI